MALSDLQTLEQVRAARAGKPLGKGRPRVLDRIEQKREADKRERECRRAVRVRDKGRCVVPGCRAASKHLHHMLYRSKGGTWQSNNICSLCVLHHQLVHAALLSIAGNADTVLVFTEGTRP